ncbi:hypothetical protein EJ110_NYTH26015 [Nymphaea thermarum]|nr:hypothetical protein EJ110_NYTH26015 [Nymphaea thermarum]
MSIAYGWPQPDLCPTSQRIVFLRVSNGLLLVVSPFHLELWSSSQHRVRLGKFLRDTDSVQKEGENVEAIWSPDNSRVAVMEEFSDERAESHNNIVPLHLSSWMDIDETVNLINQCIQES